MKHAVTVRKLYLDVLGREPDIEGYTIYANLLENEELTKEEIIDILMNSEEYKNICVNKMKNNQDYESFINNVKNLMNTPIIKNKYTCDLCIAIVESRPNVDISVSLFLTTYFIEFYTDIHIYTPKTNVENIKQSISFLINSCFNVYYHDIDNISSKNQYSKLLLSREFWKCLEPYKLCLITQSDGFLIKKGLCKFVDDILEHKSYEYIGSLHKQNLDKSYLYNGGLSLRCIQSSLDAIDSFYCDDISEDVFFNKHLRIAPFEIGVTFAIEHYYDAINIEDIVGCHQIWGCNNNEITNKVFSNILKHIHANINSSYETLNNLYITILERNVDETGVKSYINLIQNNKIKKVEQILYCSDEYKMLVANKIKMNTYVKNLEYRIANIRNIHNEYFEVVVARYKEDPYFLEYFDSFNCKVFLYNKGPKIEHTFKSNKIFVKTVPNNGYEDYIYAHHIVAHYDILATHNIFIQCNIDHNPAIFEHLNDIKNFNNFESLSTSLGLHDYHHKKGLINTDYGIMLLTDEHMIQTQSINDLFFKYTNDNRWCDGDFNFNFLNRYSLYKRSNPKFIPGAQFYISRKMLHKTHVDNFKTLQKDIEYFASKGQLISKLYAEICERFIWPNLNVT